MTWEHFLVYRVSTLVALQVRLDKAADLFGREPGAQGLGDRGADALAYDRLPFRSTSLRSVNGDLHALAAHGSHHAAPAQLLECPRHRVWIDHQPRRHLPHAWDAFACRQGAR